MKKRAEISTNRAGEELQTWKDEEYWGNSAENFDNKFLRKDPLVDSAKKRLHSKIQKAMQKKLEKTAVLEDAGDTGAYNGIVDAFRQGQGYSADGWAPEYKAKGTDSKVNAPKGFHGNFIKAVEKKRSKKDVRK